MVIFFHEGNIHSCDSDGAALAAEHRRAFFRKAEAGPPRQLSVHFVLWGYGINRDILMESGFQRLSGFTLLYVGFGLVIAAVAFVSLIS